jgi:putative DNA primase/helicase
VPSDDRIPAELREWEQWVVWRLEKNRDAKLTKVPYRSHAITLRASSINPATWSTYEDAVAAAEADGVAGLGFVFTGDDPFAAVDFDHCVAGQDVNPHVANLMRQLDSYTEVSPSGTGLHTIIRAKLNGGPCSTSKTPWGAKFENYDKERFFTFTGRHLPDTPRAVNERQVQLVRVRAVFWPPKEMPKPARAATPAAADDRELLERMFAARNGGAIERLYGGDTSGHGNDDSVADLALVGHLAFWCGPDPARIDRLFRGSGLMREKWDERRGDSTTARRRSRKRSRDGPSSTASAAPRQVPSLSRSHPLRTSRTRRSPRQMPSPRPIIVRRSASRPPTSCYAGRRSSPTGCGSTRSLGAPCRCSPASRRWANPH